MPTKTDAEALDTEILGAEMRDAEILGAETLGAETLDAETLDGEIQTGRGHAYYLLRDAVRCQIQKQVWSLELGGEAHYHVWLRDIRQTLDAETLDAETAGAKRTQQQGCCALRHGSESLR